MGAFDFVKNLYNRGSNIVNNDVIQPFQRDVAQPVHSAESAIFRAVQPHIINAWQNLNPGSGVNKARPIVNNALNQVQATPMFRDLINQGHPSMANSFAPGGVLVSGPGAAAETDMNNHINQIQLGQGYGSTPEAVVHEALHRQWALNPNDHQNFLNSYAQELKSNPKLASTLEGYLTNRLHNYKNAPAGSGLDEGGVPIASSAYNNINSLDPEVLNEVHSYIPEFLSNAYGYNHLNSSDPLVHYYSQFFNPAQTQIVRGHSPAQTPINIMLNSLRKR